MMTIREPVPRRAPPGLVLASARQIISVLVPIYNEEGNLSLLCERLFAVLRANFSAFEVIAINDGSRDGSLPELTAAAGRYRELKIVDLRRNYGQTAALMAGIDHASGEIIVMIDADLQNDPEDIPELIVKLNEGYDVVSGWRKDRKDAPVRRNLVSRLANRLISSISGVALNDYGCTLKAYRHHVLKGMRLYGEMHRFIPIYANWMGAKIAEVPVRHHPRKFGHSKYGLERVVKVLLDLMVVKFLDRHFVKPIYVFGGFGIFSLLLSALSTLYMLYLKVFEGISMILTPLPIVSTMTFLVGVMSILMGLLAEMLVRTYFESQQRPAYAVRDLINFHNGA
jgi:glycosyltransferase involved in cell wall biosynthesis